MISDKQITIHKEAIFNRKKNKEKSKQDIFLHLLNLYHHLQNKIDPNSVIHQVQDLYKLLCYHPRDKNQKMLKKIKSQLSQMKCFKIPPIYQTNPEFNEIFKRDNSNIINMTSPFIQMTRYLKGSIAETTGFKRNSIKILLFGEVCMFQSVNQKTFKNCQTKIKNDEINIRILQHSQQMLNQIFMPPKILNPELNIQKQTNSYFITQQQEKIQSLQKQVVSPQKTVNDLLTNLEQNPQNFNIGQVLTRNQCRIILVKCGIISPITPHKNSRNFQSGDFIFDKEQPLFVDQKAQYYSSVVCCTDCIFLEIGYQIAKEVIQLINSDRQRPYILALLFKFPKLKYFQAKQYVTQQFMIAQQIQQQEGGIIVTKRSAVQIVKQLKVISSLNYELSFTGNIYLIISGCVTLVIDQISQRKPSTIEYAIPQKSIINKQILQLYKNQIFGFEQIGYNKKVNLRYLTTMGSKLLKINRSMFRHHLQVIPGFKNQIDQLKRVRNQLIIQIISKMQQLLQSSQLKRHQSITFSKSQSKLAKIKSTKSTQLTNQTKQIKQLKYYGRQKFQQISSRIKKHFSPENTDIPKQALSPQIVKQNGLGIQFSQNLVKRPNQSIQIKDGWVQIRNKKGTLLRKKKVKQSDKSDNAQKGDAILRKLGILSSKQIADHNHEIVKKRQSKYQFQDLQQQAKQFRQIRKRVQSLPKLTNFFAKKQNRIFSIIYKRTHL